MWITIEEANEIIEKYNDCGFDEDILDKILGCFNIVEE